MVLNKNIFCASDPTKILDSLWELIKGDQHDIQNMTIFLPSRRAVRSVEKMIANKMGGAVVLPKLVALGEGAEEESEERKAESENIISNQERILILAKLLSADANIRTLSNALPIASDLVRMQDYIENENDSPTMGGCRKATGGVNWNDLIGEKYAEHFRAKAKFLDLVSNVLPTLYGGRITSTQKRNSDIRGWINHQSPITNHQSRVIVCGSTASVPATADLMAHIASLPNGYIILPGKINHKAEGIRQKAEVFGECDPYASEWKFLERIGATPDDVQIINVGDSAIDFFNNAFSNDPCVLVSLCPCAQLIECPRESVEAECVAEIASGAIAQNKTVLVITPDAAGNQRIAAAFDRRGLVADFSGGLDGTRTLIGRAILNLFDDWCDAKDYTFDQKYKSAKENLFETVLNIIETMPDQMAPAFEIDDTALSVLESIKTASDILLRNGITVGLSDARAIVADSIGAVSLRPPMNNDAKIAVLGTIESRMQTADIVILTGLNEGMFPDRGYENAWLPRHVSASIGLPSPDRKVSLMALDFMTLSCAKTVYWLRSKTAGSSQTTESRFLSRVAVLEKKSAERRAQSEDVNSFKLEDKANLGLSTDSSSSLCALRSTLLLGKVLAQDNVPHVPLDYSPPRPPADRSDVYVTELELLIHNPYAFYVRHILRLRVRDDYWVAADARKFGDLVHKTIEELSIINYQLSISEVVSLLDSGAKKILPVGSVVFHFWHKRFVEMAPAIIEMLKASAGGQSEIKLETNIAGRKVKAIADRVFVPITNHESRITGYVLDIKTGAAPNKKQLMEGNMPQLPLEAYMLTQSTEHRAQSTVMQFLQLKNNDVRLIEYNGEMLQQMIDASVQKVSELFGRYSRDFEPYEYYETSDAKYKAYDDLARVDD